MKTNGNHEPPNASKAHHNKHPKLITYPTSAFPTVQTHVKLSNIRDLRQDTNKQKIPRPPNAFMLFANDFRRKLAGEFPKESNKDISIRLGCMWKSMERDTKEKYFQLAKEVDAAHKRKYPDYVYNPKEARLRKALREKSRGERQGGPASSGQRGGAPASWSKPRQNMNSRQPICVQMVGEQQQLQHRQLHHQHQQQYLQLQQQHQQQSQQVSLLRGNNNKQQIGGGSGSGTAAAAANMMLQNYNDYLDLSYHHVAQAADYTLLPEHQSESWYSSSFLQQQGPDQNASSSSYAIRSESRKVTESNEWNSHFASDANSAFIHSNPENTAEKDSSRNEYLDSGREQATVVNGGPHHHPQQQCMTASASGGQDNNGPVSVPDIEMENGVLLEPNLLESKALLNLSQPSHGKLQSAAEGAKGAGNKDGLRLPGFHQAFGSTEIGRFSQHEEFFEAQPLPPPPPQDAKTMKFEMHTPPRAFFDNEAQSSASYFDSPKVDPLSPAGSWSFLFNSPTAMLETDFDNALPFIDYSLLATDLTLRHDPEEILPDVVKSANEVKIKREEATQSSSESNDDPFEAGPFMINEFTSNQQRKSVGMTATEDFARRDFQINHLEQHPVIISENDKICVMMESANGSSDTPKGFNYL